MMDCFIAAGAITECPIARSGLAMRVQLAQAAASAEANALLSALPHAVYRRLLPDLQTITLHPGEVLCRTNDHLKFAYFPTNCIVAAMYGTDEAGSMAKAWPVGREGMLGISLFLGVERLDNQAEVQVGGTAFRIPAAALLSEFRQAGALQHLLLRYAFALIMQASQLAACSHCHPIEQRLCRFLLLAFDRVGAAEIELTQQRIAELLGVRRVSVTHAAMGLQRDNLIEYVRGRVRLINRKRLAQRSCACAGIIVRGFAAVTA
jgi:CRP-like cAMP-binding protein